MNLEKEDHVVTGKKLVAYFSASGVTAAAAKALAQAADADVYEIRPQVPYTSEDLDWTNKKSRSSVEMNDLSSRPALADQSAGIAEYDTIFLGFPIWWGVAPTIINTFLESYDFSGKKIILFATSGGSGFGRTANALKASVSPDTEIVVGKLLNGRQSAAELKKWAEDIAPEDGKAAHAAEMMFPIGAPNDAFAKYFTGQSYLAPVSTEQVGIFNVTFEPGCRNNWHVHHADKGGGQILICVAGRGYYQEWGKDAVEMKPGDCINIPVGVKHWHGAAPDSWFSHLAVEVPGENSSNEWLEAVSDEQYGILK
ncbi:MAG: cupin domain-containing protein [Lachnospiraceae bacterium]|nr:cupin domain-containing protein [Lachnospiraceae bacterium]